MTGKFQNFMLQQEFVAHKRAVRAACFLSDCSIITGGLDSTIAIWKENSASFSSEFYSLFKRLEVHDGGVYSLAASKIEEPNFSFYSGGKDAKILRISSDGEVISKYLGHKGPICSLVESFDSVDLVSGSWDGTAIVWDVLTCVIKYILDGHSYAVCVAVPESLNGFIITGSQDGCIRFWQNGQQTLKIPRAHGDIIRNFAILENAFLSASNDAAIKAWSVDGKMLLNVDNAHDAFIFDIKLAKSLVEDVAITAADDCYVKVWNVQKGFLLQSIPHPDTIWQVTPLLKGTFGSCCEDGKFRIWTQEEFSALPPEERKMKEEEAVSKLENLKKLQQKDSLDVSKLPDVSILKSERGVKEGQYKLVREGNVGYTYVWESGNWNKLGEIVPQNNTVFFEGDEFFPAGEYDYVFFVEIGDSTEKKKLPFNKSQNPQVTAENFCAREKIPKSSVTEIVAFIQKNANLTETSAKKSESFTSTCVKSSKYFPLRTVHKYDKSNWDAIFKRIQELNSSLKENVPFLASEKNKVQPFKLSATDLTTLKGSIEKLSHKNFLKREFKGSELKIIFQLLSTWENEMTLPVIDIWRALALHPAYSDAHKGSDNGWRFIAIALKQLSLESSSIPLIICCLRFIANVFFYTANRHILYVHSNVVLSSFSSLITSNNSKVRLALATVLANFCVGFNDFNDSSAKMQVFQALKELINFESEDPEVYFRAVVALGTLLVNEASLLAIAKDDFELSVSLKMKYDNPLFSDNRSKEVTDEIANLLMLQLAY